MEVFCGGAWREITSAEAFVNGAWRSLSYAEAYVDGQWRTVANFTPAGSGGGGGGTITLSLNTSSVNVATFNSSTNTSNVTATPSGGLAPYTYSWVKQSGGAITASFPTVATTRFAASGLTVDETRSAIFRCTCTDALGSTATADVSVSITRIERPTTQ